MYTHEQQEQLSKHFSMLYNYKPVMHGIIYIPNKQL